MMPILRPEWAFAIVGFLYACWLLYCIGYSLWRYIDDQKQRVNPILCWLDDSFAIYKDVDIAWFIYLFGAFIVCVVFGALLIIYPIVILIAIVLAIIYLLRSMRRGQKKLIKVAKYAHDHSDKVAKIKANI